MNEDRERQNDCKQAIQCGSISLRKFNNETDRMSSRSASMAAAKNTAARSSSSSSATSSSSTETTYACVCSCGCGLVWLVFNKRSTPFFLARSGRLQLRQQQRKQRHPPMTCHLEVSVCLCSLRSLLLGFIDFFVVSLKTKNENQNGSARSCIFQNYLLRMFQAAWASGHWQRRSSVVQATMWCRAMQRRVLEEIFGSTTRSRAVLQIGRRSEQVREQVALVQEVDARRQA